MAAPSPPNSRPTRRAFLAALAAGGAGLSAAAYARYAEPTWIELAEVPLDRALFPAPPGLRILHLSDLHLGPHVSLAHIEHAVELGLAQRPDLIALTGDFITTKYERWEEYTALLAEKPIDLICLGIGENGHIAFNDPPVADFEDPHLIKIVELDHACRQQQVNDGCFPNLDAVPRHAFSLTVSIFRRARRLSIHVPGPRKAAAVQATIEGPITTACPASILRLHPEATPYVDRASAQLLRA